MGSNDSLDHEMECTLRDYFAAESGRLRAPADTWARLERRLGQPRFGWFGGGTAGMWRVWTAAPAVQAAAGAPSARRQPAAPRDTTFKDFGRQPAVSTSEDAVSTFSLDTDRTSYHLALNWARSGYEVEPDSVRAEEWINAFDYRYDPPSDEWGFAITSDVSDHPLDSGKHLARIAFQAPLVAGDTPLNVTLVLDASGSMEGGNRVAIARAAAEAIKQSLRAQDRIAVVHFTTDVIGHLTVEHSPPDDPSVEWSIGSLAPHDSTNVQSGLDLGVMLADRIRRERPEAYNYVILMSDGVANVDATSPFGILESAYDPDSSNPLRLITIGVGVENYNDYLLEQLAQHGNGWYRYLSDVDQARATFSRDNWVALASPFADQTRAQVVWDARVVKSWRIIGYDNRVTPDQTFVEDRKEFAEIHSGAATTVFYELELHDQVPRGGAEEVEVGRVELRWVTPDTGQSRGQRAVVSGRAGGRSFDLQAPLFQLGAIVGLASDRYNALPHADAEGYFQAYEEMVVLRDLLGALDGYLDHLDAYHDFAFLLNHITRSVEAQAPPAKPSGYSP